MARALWVVSWSSCFLLATILASTWDCIWWGFFNSFFISWLNCWDSWDDSLICLFSSISVMKDDCRLADGSGRLILDCEWWCLDTLFPYIFMIVKFFKLLLRVLISDYFFPNSLLTVWLISLFLGCLGLFGDLDWSLRGFRKLKSTWVMDVFLGRLLSRSSSYYSCLMMLEGLGVSS